MLKLRANFRGAQMACFCQGCGYVIFKPNSPFTSVGAIIFASESSLFVCPIVNLAVCGTNWIPFSFSRCSLVSRGGNELERRV